MGNYQITNIKFDKAANSIQIDFYSPSKNTFVLSGEYLRVLSPSAENKVRIDQPMLAGKKNVKIDQICLSGNYAVKISFDDGHHTGLYTWPYLWEICNNQTQYWQKYLDNLHEHGWFRDPDESKIKVIKS